MSVYTPRAVLSCRLLHASLSTQSALQWRIEDIPRGEGHNPREGVVNLLFNKISEENCMKIKEIGPRAGHASPAPFGSASATSVNFIQYLDELEMGSKGTPGTGTLHLVHPHAVKRNVPPNGALTPPTFGVAAPILDWS